MIIENAKQLALGISELKGVSVDPDLIETNIVIFDITPSGMTAPQVAESLKQRGVLIHAFGKTQIRLVTHLGISSEDVEKALEAFRLVFR